DPQGPYIDKGKIADSTDEWAIDGTVLQKDDGALYFVWSGWEVGKTAEVQVIYIAPMANPWTISGERVKICEPSYEWERHDQPVNEGPQILRRDEKIFIVYSASASWRSNYCMGMLANIDGNVLNPTSWRKSPLPVFSRNDEAGLYSVGHCSFTTSPDGSEDWLLYHGMADPDGRWKDRSTRMQKFTWNDDGTPHFGKPVADELELPSPSGEK
ncbi:MAG: putative beta-xylosidase, partial [Paenibacillaceae bacterium]|nr:putative beta-xylosidase [Paenibacillaceae bacterium]